MSVSSPHLYLNETQTKPFIAQALYTKSDLFFFDCIWDLNSLDCGYVVCKWAAFCVPLGHPGRHGEPAVHISGDALENILEV